MKSQPLPQFLYRKELLTTADTHPYFTSSVGDSIAVADIRHKTSLLVNMNIVTNAVSNNNKYTRIRYSEDELSRQGAVYLERFFPAEEIIDLTEELRVFSMQQDSQKVLTFFQRIRFSPHESFKWYLTTTRLIMNARSNISHLNHIAINVDDLSIAGKKIGDIRSEEIYRLQNLPKFELLSPREREIIQLIANGLSSYEIGEKLYISIHTVNNHRKNILNKLEIVSIAQLVRFAVVYGLID